MTEDTLLILDISTPGIFSHRSCQFLLLLLVLLLILDISTQGILSHISCQFQLLLLGAIIETDMIYD
jgi:hypothetical protein